MVCTRGTGRNKSISKKHKLLLSPDTNPELHPLACAAVCHRNPCVRHYRVYRIGVVCTVIDFGAAVLPQGPINTIYPDFVGLDAYKLVFKYIGLLSSGNRGIVFLTPKHFHDIVFCHHANYLPFLKHKHSRILFQYS